MNKNHVAILFCLMIILSGCEKERYISEPVTAPTDVHISSSKQVHDELIQTYTNERYGFEIQYPSFLALDDSRATQIGFANTTCRTNTKLCILGIDGISIDITESSPATDVQQLYSQLREDGACKEILIFPLPENFNEEELVKAMRCTFEEVPKQAKGGYTYTILKDATLFTVTMYQGDATVPAYEPGNPGIVNLTRASYDPLGDMMMRTFKFTK